MNGLKSWQEKIRVLWRHFKFYISREISYPLVEPDMLQLCFLFRCNLSCKMCSMRKRAEIVKRSGHSYELPFDTIINLITQAKKMGIMQLYLVGGEPFLRQDLFNIIKFSYSHNMETVVVTNGTFLDNIKIINEILDSKLKYLSVSIDGACEDTYNEIRGEGIFAKINDNIRLLNKIKKERQVSFPRVFISCTIMNSNIEELIDIVYLAKELEADGINFQPVVIDNTDQKARDSSDQNWIPESRYRILDKSIDKLMEYKLSNKDNFKFILTNLNQLRRVKQYFRGGLHKQKCYMGFNRIIISQDGKIYFCAEEPHKGEISFGDIYKEDLRSLWHSHKARIFRKSIKNCRKPCLLGCTRRNEFDSFIDGLYSDFLLSPGQFIK